MAYDIAANLRNTLGFVTDGANETGFTDADVYPTTHGGVTGGHGGALASRDRNASLDRRLAGIFFGTDYFRLDLPTSGDAIIHLALGDAGANQTGNTVVVKDNTTTLFTIGPHDTAGVDHLWDAADVDLSAAAWPGSEAGRSVTFASTILKAELSGSSGALMHLRAVQIALGPTSSLGIGRSRRQRAGWSVSSPGGFF